MKNDIFMKGTLPFELEEEVLTAEDVDKPAKLIVYNDDFNTFEYVESCLMRICKHGPEQAKQCSHLIHWRGSCCVKVGTRTVLGAMEDALTRCGLRVDLQ